MNTFDQQLNRLLSETYFGGSPYQQATGIKRHITFENEHALGDGAEKVSARGRGRNESEAFKVYTNVDKGALGEVARKFFEYVVEINREEPAKVGGMIKTASTGPGSNIRTAFENVFSDLPLTLNLDFKNEGNWLLDRDGKRYWEGPLGHQESSYTQGTVRTIIFQAPEMEFGKEEQFINDGPLKGLNIVAEYSTRGDDTIIVDPESNTYRRQDNQSFPLQRAVGELIGVEGITISVKGKAIDLDKIHPPFVTFGDDISYGMSNK